MRTRFTVNDEGNLVSKDGVVLGRVVGITIDSPRGTIGGSSGHVLSDNALGDQQRLEGLGCGEGDRVTAVQRIWNHYVEVMQPRNFRLLPAERALIKEALKVASEGECLMAIDGCRASKFHMGDNDRGKKYNRLSQILKGKRGIRTAREQIDMFIDVVSANGAVGTGPKLDWARVPGIVKDHWLSVLAGHRMPNDEDRKQEGDEAERWLRSNGWRVVRAPGAAPRLEERPSSDGGTGLLEPDETAAG